MLWMDGLILITHSDEIVVHVAWLLHSYHSRLLSKYACWLSKTFEGVLLAKKYLSSLVSSATLRLAFVFHPADPQGIT